MRCFIDDACKLVGRFTHFSSVHESGPGSHLFSPLRDWVQRETNHLPSGMCPSSGFVHVRGFRFLPRLSIVGPPPSSTHTRLRHESQSRASWRLTPVRPRRASLRSNFQRVSGVPCRGVRSGEPDSLSSVGSYFLVGMLP